MSEDLKISKYDEVKGKNTLNVSTILSIWYALNFKKNILIEAILFFQNLRRYMLSQSLKNKLVKRLRYIMKSVLTL
jgi:hypothetical protein